MIVVIGDLIKWNAQLGFNDVVKDGIDDLSSHIINTKYDVQELYERLNFTQATLSGGLIISDKRLLR